MPLFQFSCSPEDLRSIDFPKEHSRSVSAHSGLVNVTWQDQRVCPVLQASCRTIWTQGRSCLYFEVPERVKSVFFDMDSTLIGQETIVELARESGSSEEVSSITESAMAGEIDFNQALLQRVATLKGLNYDQRQRVHQRLVISPGVEQFSKWAKRKGLKLFLVSGGFSEFAREIAKKLAFDGFLANQLEEDAGQLTGRVNGKIIDGQAKRDYLLECCRRLSLQPAECIAVGDGANDLQMMQSASLALGFQPKPILYESLHGALYGSLTPLIDVFANIS